MKFVIDFVQIEIRLAVEILGEKSAKIVEAYGIKTVQDFITM